MRSHEHCTMDRAGATAEAARALADASPDALRAFIKHTDPPTAAAHGDYASPKR